MLKRFIAEKSGGKLKLDLSKLKFELLSNRIQIQEADLVSTDTLHQPITYHIKFQQLTLRVASVWPLLFKKQLLFDTIQLNKPEIEIFQWHKDTTQRSVKEDISLPQEMGKLYQSMLDALDEFGIQRIAVNNARISLINKMRAGTEPVTISRINLDVIRKKRRLNRTEKFSGEQTVELNVSNQQIALPGGRHKLAFKTFKLQLFRQRIELDSCTVTATSRDSGKSSYRIFFKKLLLLGVDLDALERENVIKADSVYCENPFFYLDLHRSDAANRKNQVPDPDKILKDLTGNLNLAFVGVKNAGINININGKRKTSIFNSNKDDFEMRGLLIKPDSAKPVTVQRFDMTVRDYHLYNQDSSTTYKFDSLHFLNDKVVLNNFSVLSTPNRLRKKNFRDFSIPYFELTRLDWYQLIFDQNVVAEAAYLKDPVIVYTRLFKSTRDKKLNLFNSLQSMDDLMTLERITVENGRVNVKTGSSTELNFNNVHLDISSNRLLGSKNRQGLQNAVERLTFSNGSVHLDAFTARLTNARYTANKIMYADKIVISGNRNNSRAIVNGIKLNNLRFDNEGNNVSIDALNWNSASVMLQSPISGSTDSRQRSVLINNVSGNNTQFNFTDSQTNVSAFIQQLQTRSIRKFNNEPVTVEGLHTQGNNLLIKSGNFIATSNEYLLSNIQESYVKNVSIDQVSAQDTLNIKSPEIGFATLVKAFPVGKFVFEHVHINKPAVYISKVGTSEKKMPFKYPAVGINDLTINEPSLNIQQRKKDVLSSLIIPYSHGNVLKIKNINLAPESSSAEKLLIKLSAANLNNGTKPYSLDSVNMHIAASDLTLYNEKGKTKWQGLIDSVGFENSKAAMNSRLLPGLNLSRVYAGNVRLTSDGFSNVAQLLNGNLTSWVRLPEGEYRDGINVIKWYNAEYSGLQKKLRFDSFLYHPVLPKDSFFARAKFRSDYTTLSAAGLTINNFEPSRYKTDSAFIAEEITLDRPHLTLYKDKRLPLPPAVFKPLYTSQISRIISPVAIKQINIVNGDLLYTEKDSSSRKDGNLRISRVNGFVANINNQSENIYDSLQLNVTGYLMDTLKITLWAKQSYADPMSGFRVKIKTAGAPLPVINPFLTALANIKITSGTLDSLFMEATADNKFAIGKIRIHYKGLVIRTVKDGEYQQTSFKNKLMNLLLNTFILKKNGGGRTGLVYFKRLQDRSFFNYLIKMTLSGLATGTGIKSNRAYIKEYRKAKKASENSG